MEDMLTPGNVIVVAIVLVGLVVGIRRAVDGLVRGRSCCSDGAAPRRNRSVPVADVDELHYPFSAELHIGGMSCQGCADTVADALNSVPETWATVDLATKTARIRSRNPIDIDVCATAVRNAGYRVIRP